MRTVYWYVYFAISMFLKTFPLKKLKKEKGRMDQRAYEDAVNQISSQWAKKQVINSGAKITLKGKENLIDGPVLFVSNHQSNFDIALFMSEIDKNKGYIAKAELLKVPVLRSWMMELRCVFMDRSSMKQSLKAIIEGIDILKDGYSLVIFPEGTRSKGGPVKDFKAGSFKLATKSKVPIIPVTLDGTYRIMEANNNRIKPAEVKITIHPPIETKSLSKEEEGKLPETVKGIIEGALK